MTRKTDGTNKTISATEIKEKKYGTIGGIVDEERIINF